MSVLVMMLGVLLLPLYAGRPSNAEKAPLYMFTTATDAREATNITAGRIDFIVNGETASNIFDNPRNALAVPIPMDISITPFSFLACIEGMTVNFTLMSMNTGLLGNPVLSIPNSFVFPTCPFRIFTLYPCNATTIQAGQFERLLTQFKISAYTRDKEFDPIVLYFYKNCGSDSPKEFIDVTEFPSDPGDHLRVTGNPGCYNDTDLPDKPIMKGSSTSSVSPGAIVAAVVVSILLLIVVVIVVTASLIWHHRRNKIYEFNIERMAETYKMVDNPIFDRVDTLNQAGAHEKEFSSEKITFVRELGEGAFGRVYQGMVANIIAGEDSTMVAVKQLKLNNGDDGSTMVNFFKEVTFMSKLDHPRMVKLLGVCSVTEPYCMIFEYMDLGDLNSYLRSAIGLGPDCDEALNKETCFLQLSDLLSIVEQIAEGMEYLSNQNLVHRDLATRNCLVATGPTVKISDFGLSRDVNTTDYYRVRGRAVLPIRWMAPESIMYGKFTTATDVWSFGVVVWEVFTYGQQPYVGMTNEEVINFIATKQGTLEPPSGCPQKVTKIMTQCWSQSPGSRPSFSKLLTTIKQLPSILKDVVYDSPDYIML